MSVPRGYRYLILAAVGGLTLTGATKDHASQGHQAKGDRGSQQSVAAAPVVKPTVGASETKPADPKCKDNRGADADCTVVATDAALEQARDADLQAWAAIAGVAIGGLTLVAAFLAAKWAKAAARHTETGATEARRSAEAAEASLQHTRDTVDIQVRPYVTIRYGKLYKVENDTWCISGKIVNSGTIPAKDVKVYIVATLGSIPFSKDAFGATEAHLFPIVIPSADSPASVFTGITITPEDFEAIKQYEKFIVCKISLVYTPLPHLPEERHEVEMALFGMDIKQRAFRSLPDWAYTGWPEPDQTEMDV